jgi:uncharacterized membrane protein AbrB (regulator of aidB expression)
MLSKHFGHSIASLTSFILSGDLKFPLGVLFLNSILTRWLSLGTTFEIGLSKFFFELAQLSFDLT